MRSWRAGIRSLGFLGAILLARPELCAADLEKEEAWIAKRRSFWAYQKPQRPRLPSISDPWIRTPVDAFLLEAMREKRLSPSPAASKETLIRRVTLDLTGLPPTPGEIDAFLRDTAPGAYERLVERLLASPQYGERWAQRWLDVVRYADTNGFELDAERPHAWRYRDYVVRSFNRDKPYDRFVQEQVAGDELFPGDKEALIATGFHRAGPIHIVGGNQDEEMNRQEVLTEMTGAIGSVFLGMTIACARCHNHKFDPIPQSDYYRLQAVFAATEFKDTVLASDSEKQAYEVARKAHQARLKPIQEEIARIEKPYRERIRAQKFAALDQRYKDVLAVAESQRDEKQKTLAKEAEAQLKVSWDEVLAVLSPEDRERRAALRQKMHRLEYDEPEPPETAYGVQNLEKAPPTHILKVGDHRYKLDPVSPGFPRVIAGLDAQAPETAANRRAALARWLTSVDHPLVARVMVNRIWQFRMGTGLVATPNDFGALGARPTHPQLLDWLATEFIACNWSVKTIDRLIVLSSAYRQSAAHDPAKAKIDPENKFYWRMNRRRLEAEAIRDSILAVSGKLNPQLGGKPIKVPIEKEVYDSIFTEAEPDNLWPVALDPNQHYRRSLYLLNKRTVRLPLLANFDQPDAMSSCPVRAVSTHALQALSLMNSEFVRQQAAFFARRLQAECGQQQGCQIRRAYRLALARLPRPAETAMARAFLDSGGLLEDFLLAMVNRNEFVYIP
ncbi:MAG: DUF1553 domain-containing protein [Bryobacteraceae bacterium]|nr:DUF1553 domain-containing protein [Bryobacteraceae bacterium]MDW8377188.1 DUF1553 domain-containing protein [Bryobacterales bacterium]